MVVIGRCLWRSSGLIPFLSQGHLVPVAQDLVQIAFKYPQEWRIHDLPEQSVSVSGHPRSAKVLPDIQKKPPVFCFVPIVLFMPL